MNILLADDETPARGELRHILATLLPEAVFFEATNGEEALAMIEREAVDAVFLDIQMPGPDGLAVAAALMENPQPPFIVFATAFDEHALSAFELAALDYVVKPFDERRLARTAERLRQTLAERALLDERQAAMRRYLVQNAPPARFTKLWGQRENESWALVDFKDVLWIEATGKRTHVRTTAGEMLLLGHTLKDLEPRLAAHNILRIHKSYLVNLDHVAQVSEWFSGAYQVKMADGTTLPMSRRYAAQVKRMTGW